jgi:8-oxo-dGTP diphosphatase
MAVQTAAAQDIARVTAPRLGSAVVVRDRGRVLLGVRGKEPNKGKWVLPGGKIHPFESIEDAAVREALEETGLVVQVEGQLGVWEIINPPEHRVIVYNLARPVGGALRASSDLDDVRFYGREEIASLDISEIVRCVLDRIDWD